MLCQFNQAPSTLAWCSDVLGPFASLPLRWWSLYGTTALIGENWQWHWRHEHDFPRSISDGRGREAKGPRTTSDVWASGYINSNPDILKPQIFVTRIRVNRALITTLESGSSELIHWFSRAQKPRSIRLKKMRLQQCPDSRRRGLNLFHLPLPLANINTYFSLRAKCWLRGGVGEQFPRNL